MNKNCKIKKKNEQKLKIKKLKIYNLKKKLKLIN